MKVGFPIWYGNKDRLRQIVSNAVKAKFDYIEVSLDYPWPFEGEIRLLDVINLINDHGLKIAFHGPWRDIRLSSPIEQIRRASVEVCKELLKSISKIESEYVVLHLSTDQATDRSQITEKNSIRAAIRSAEELISFGADLGIKVVLENVRERLHEFEKVVSEVKPEICLDVGHIAIVTIRKEKRENIKDEITRWIGALRKWIRIIHFSGVEKQKHYVRDHLLTNKGDPHFKAVIEELKGLEINNFLLEIFEDVNGKEVDPLQLMDLVDAIKSI